MAAHSHDVGLVWRSESPNLLIGIKKSADHSIFLTLSPMRTMEVEQVKKLIFFPKCKDIISFVGPSNIHGGRLKKMIPSSPNVATDHVKQIVHRKGLKTFFGKEYRKGIQGNFFLTSK